MRRIVILTTLVLFSALYTGCAGTPVDENDPSSLLSDAESDIQSDHYQIAIEKLRSIKNKFPYSKHALDAQLRIADVYFLEESYAEAAAAYETFKDLHPKHEKAGYAMFRAGKSYFKDIPGNVARDLTSARKAIDAYADFLARYPQDPLAEQATKDTNEIRRLLAEKELYIADFYFRRDFYDSAKPRYKKIIELYPETHAAKTAQEKLAKMESKQERGNP